MVLLVLLPMAGVADQLVAWNVDGIDVEAGLIPGDSYGLGATTPHVSGKISGMLSLGGGVNPSTTAGQYGFKVSEANEQTTLSGAIAENHYIQFTLVADSGYRFDLFSIDLNGESTGSGCDNVAILSSVDGFSDADAMMELANRQGVTGGFDTDGSGWGSPIDLTASGYQDLSTVTFRIYGWNSTSGSGVTYIRNLSGDDLVVNGTLKAIPEPAVMGFIGLVGIGALVARRFVE
ncbi:hypothetical protein PDESU_00685 [Pontiella desulfatans]|uniref:PEP-CTERM protein-sorting domain-containing protein n=1 Tax=Pontiella desulfatans TaxID=2750659 RepID=A0A6C2TXA4_PONDE|nr:hypothetical protein [Pontiella desulfatans]VGO12134.1 hypothetical protein PDESU_00685 [Pontiella desulfatans]